MKETNCLIGHDEGVMSVCVSPDNRYIASGSTDNTLRLWDPASGNELQRFDGRTNLVSQMCFSPDGNWLASGSLELDVNGMVIGHPVRVWEVPSGREVHRFYGHSNMVMACRFSADGRYLVSGGFDAQVRIWNLTDPSQPIPTIVHSQRSGTPDALERPWVWSVCFLPDGQQVVSACGDSTLVLWEVATSREIRRFCGHQNHVQSVCCSPDGQFLFSGGLDATVRMWNVATGQEVARFEEHKAHVPSVSISPDGRFLLSGSGDKTVRIWEIDYSDLSHLDGTPSSRGEKA